MALTGEKDVADAKYDKWLTLDELASYLNVSKSALYKIVQEGRIPGGKVGRGWRFDRDEIDRWVKQGKSRKDRRK